MSDADYGYSNPVSLRWFQAERSSRKHLKHLFPRQVSYNRFVELEKEVLLPMTIFIKKVLLGTCTGISFADSTPYGLNPKNLDS